jgi:hypothetical protein
MTGHHLRIDVEEAAQPTASLVAIADHDLRTAGGGDAPAAALGQRNAGDFRCVPAKALCVSA